MQQKEMSGAERYTRQNHRRRTWQKVVGTLACVVVFCTTYALILPAITQENTVYCALEEHVHTDACYAHAEQTESAQEVQFAPEPSEVSEVHEAQVTQLVCTYETLNVHTHSEDCFDADGNYLCGKADYVAHHHDSSCYDQSGTLVCQLPERSSHIHSESCYAVTEGHTHSESCYETRQGDLICTLEETDGQEATEDQEAIEAHHHSDDCYTWQSVLVCGLEESESTSTLICTEPVAETHIHSESCFLTTEVTEELPEPEMQESAEPETEGSAQPETSEPVETEDILICGLEEHTHSIACYSDPNADLETAEDWEQTLARAELTGVWAEDVIAIAETQLGYTESTVNYQVAEDGTLQGITRYGQWYGDPYGDWCAMFASFCLDYAQVEGMPLESSCARWIEALTEAGLYQAAPDYTPVAGDLIFFDTDQDGLSDHMGLAVEIFENGTIKVIEGNSGDRVQYVEYELTDETILGFGLLPEQETEEEITTFTLSAETGSGIVVTVTGESTSLPFPAEEITLTAADVISEEASAIQDQALEEAGLEPEQNFLLDITLWHGEEIVEPVGPVTVTFGGLETEGYYPKVYHIDTETEDVTDMEAVSDEGGNPVISTDHFSVYGVMLLAAPEGNPISGNNITQIAAGGEYYLTADAYTDTSITITQNTVLNLNGHGVYYKGTAHFITVQSGTLTITDTSTSTLTKSSSSNFLYGNMATVAYPNDTNNRVSNLTYYVTESKVSGTGTTEKLTKYSLTPTGIIVGENASGAASIVHVTSTGTFNLDGGLLTIRHSGKYSGDCHIIYNEGTLNLNGGYVCGGYDSCWGGGIYSNNTVNMTGGVIAANCGNSGGGIAIGGGTFTMSDGVISGNRTHTGSAVAGDTNGGFGGGVYVKDGTFNFSGGYITNNSEYGSCTKKGSGCHGGGGIATVGGSFDMSGGYVTGNYSEEAGGGMYVGHYDVAGTAFKMSGGTVASNYCENSEGGGIRISGKTTGTISATEKVYITNNTMKSTYDWGGGGIFVQEKGTLNIQNALITNNKAGGYGGGVAACPTGETLIVHTEGAAIYSNIASGQHMSQGGNGKNSDTNIAQKSDVFTQNGYQDYFCVREKSYDSDISLVTGEMVGGGAANWSGSCDETAITISKTGYAAAKYLFGLTATPDNSAIAAAQEAANVIITGNSAYTHGGGIMTNGGLILGKKDGDIVTATPALEIHGKKELLIDGVSQTSGRDFTFELKDGKGTVVGTATADAATGEFTISPNAKYDKAGTYTYYLSEKNDERPGVTYDTSKYKIAVTVTEKVVSILGVNFTSYSVSAVTVVNEGKNTSTDTGFRLNFSNPSNWSNVYVYVWKTDSSGSKPVSEWPGTLITNKSDGWYTYVLSSGFSDGEIVNFIFNNGSGGSGNQTDDLSATYSSGGNVWVTGTTSDDVSTSSGSNVAFTGTSNSDGSYTLTFTNAAFTNTKTTPVSLQITKKSTASSNLPISGITFTLTDSEGNMVVSKTTTDDGTVTLTGLERGKTYELRETEADNADRYVDAGPWNVTVDSDGKITITDQTQNKDLPVEQDDPSSTTAILYTTTIYNTPWSYELPDTGGTGTEMYMMGGLLLIAVALLYGCGQRRKGERRADR